MKILFLDIETSPIKCYTWGVWQQNISPNMIIQNIKIMSVAAKWLGAEECWIHTTQNNTERNLLVALVRLLDQADVVVGHNVAGFDMKHIRGRCIRYGILPPSPYREIDTLRVARSQFKFTSNKMAELAKVLGIAEKSTHAKFPGFKLWEGCLAGDDAAWEEMSKYNIQDVVTVEELYIKLRPYMKTHPNVAIYKGKEEIICPKCGSDSSTRRGYTYTNGGKYQRFKCNTCGGWHRARTTVYDVEKKRVLTTNVF